MHVPWLSCRKGMPNGCELLAAPSSQQVYGRPCPRHGRTNMRCMDQSKGQLGSDPLWEDSCCVAAAGRRPPPGWEWRAVCEGAARSGIQSFSTPETAWHVMHARRLKREEALSG